MKQYYTSKLWERDYFSWVVLFFFNIVVFGQILSHDLLLWDDSQHICNNFLLNPPSWAGLERLWTQPYFGIFAPLTYTLWILPLEVTTWIFGPGVDCLSHGFAFHAVSLLLHWGNCIFVYGLCRFYTSDKRAALLGALIFLLHPLQVETVAWAAGTRDLLSVFLGLASLRFFLRRNWILATSLVILSLLAKPTGLVFPFLAFILLYPKLALKTLSRELGLALAISGLSMFITKSLQPDGLLDLSIPWFLRPLVFLQALGFYILKALWPFQLSVVYDRSIIMLAQDWTLFWPVLLTGGAGIWALYRPDYRKTTLVAWVLISILPVSGIVFFGYQKISTVADHYVYPAMIGVALFIATSLKTLSRIRFVVGLLCLWAVLSFLQTGYWKNGEVLFERAVQLTQKSATPHSSLAGELAKKGDNERAALEYRMTLEMDPAQRSAYDGLAVVLQRQGKDQEAEVVLRSAIQAKMALPEVYNNLGALLSRQGRLQECEGLWLEAVRGNPNLMEAYFNLGLLYEKLNQRELAAQAFSAAHRLAPNHAQVTKKFEESQR
jgi:Tfp pilus assembly protein PilF